MARPLTPRQQAVLDAIVALAGPGARPPSLRELRAATRLGHEALEPGLAALARRGLVRRESGHARTLRVVRPYVVEAGRVTPLVAVPLAGRVEAR